MNNKIVIPVLILALLLTFGIGWSFGHTDGRRYGMKIAAEMYLDQLNTSSEDRQEQLFAEMSRVNWEHLLAKTVDQMNKEKHN